MTATDRTPCEDSLLILETNTSDQNFGYHRNQQWYMLDGIDIMRNDNRNSSRDSDTANPHRTPNPVSFQIVETPRAWLTLEQYSSTRTWSQVNILPRDEPLPLSL